MRRSQRFRKEPEDTVACAFIFCLVAVFRNQRGKFFRVRRIPCLEGGRFRLDFSAESSQEFRNLVFQHHFLRLTELCILFCLTAVDKETIGGANRAVHLLCLSDKADSAYLMASAAGRTAGDVDFGSTPSAKDSSFIRSTHLLRSPWEFWIPC